MLSFRLHNFSDRKGNFGRINRNRPTQITVTEENNWTWEVTQVCADNTHSAERQAKGWPHSTRAEVTWQHPPTAQHQADVARERTRSQVNKILTGVPGQKAWWGCSGQLRLIIAVWALRRDKSKAWTGPQRILDPNLWEEQLSAAAVLSHSYLLQHWQLPTIH